MQLHSRFEAMMSDVTAGILILAKVETATVFPWYLSTPPPSTNATLETWKLDIKRGTVTSTFCISWGTQGETHMEVEKSKCLTSIFLSLSHFSSFFHFHVFSLGKLLDNGFLVWTELQLGSSQTYGPRQRHSATQNTPRKHTKKWRFSKGLIDLLIKGDIWLFLHSCSFKPYKYNRLVEGLYLWASCGFTATFSTEVSEGFQGFAALFPVYLDIPYSHTVEGIAAVTFFPDFLRLKVVSVCVPELLWICKYRTFTTTNHSFRYGHPGFGGGSSWTAVLWPLGRQGGARMKVTRMAQNDYYAKLCLAVEGSYCVKVTGNENQLDVSRIEAVMTWSLAVMKNQCNNLQYGTISGIGIGYATAIVLSAVSHVILDMFFHDAYIFCGNRAVSRVTVNFWQIYNMEPVPGKNRNVLTVLQHCRHMKDPPCRFISWKLLMLVK